MTAFSPRPANAATHHASSRMVFVEYNRASADRSSSWKASTMRSGSVVSSITSVVVSGWDVGIDERDAFCVVDAMIVLEVLILREAVSALAFPCNASLEVCERI